MIELHCPTCGVPIDDHEPSACLDALAAGFMGWKLSEETGAYLRWDEEQQRWVNSDFCLASERTCGEDEEKLTIADCFRWYPWKPAEEPQSATRILTEAARRGMSVTTSFKTPFQDPDDVWWIALGDVWAHGDGGPDALPLAVARAAAKAYLMGLETLSPEGKEA